MTNAKINFTLAMIGTAVIALGAGLGWLGGILLLVVAIIAGIYAVALFAFALSAWLVYKVDTS